MYNDKVYFSRHRPDGDWFKNAVSNTQVKIEYENKVFHGRAIWVKNDSLARKISELKYPGEDRAKETRVVLEVTLSKK